MTREKETADLLKLVAEQYKTTTEAIKSEDRTIPIPEARAVFLYLARTELELTVFESAAAVNRDHSSATVQSNKIKYRQLIYSELWYKIRAIKEKMYPQQFNKYYQMFANLGGYEI